MEEDEGSDFNLRGVQAVEDIPHRGLLEQSPTLQMWGQGWHCMRPSAHVFRASHPFHSCSETGPSCHIFFAMTKLLPGAL